MHILSYSSYFTSYTCIYKGLMILGLLENVFFLIMNMTMTRQFHNNRMQSDPQLHEEGTQNTDSHTTLKQSKPLSFSAR